MLTDKTVTEPEKILPVAHTCDVLVCGGGIAGVSAALAAARHGAKVLLLEREYALGGLATLGLITIYLPLCDGCGRQVSFGIAEELLKLSAVHGLEDFADNAWLVGGSLEDKIKRRYMVRYNPNVYAIDLEQLLVREGVEILYGTSVCSIVTDGGRITHAIVENKSGRSAVAVSAVVDATGDADVCLQAGESTETFKQGNVPAAWFYYTQDGEYKLNTLGFSDIPDSMKTPEQLENDKKSLRFGGLDADELSRLTVLSHRMLLDKFLEGGIDSPTHALSTIAAIPQIRMTRRLAGLRTMDDSEIAAEMPDSVGLFSDWRKRGPVYELPFDCLRGGRISNLFAAGRCISVTDAMWDITRVIPVCAVSGQAAGTAGALLSANGSVDTQELQRCLETDGAVLHVSQLK